MLLEVLLLDEARGLRFSLRAAATYMGCACLTADAAQVSMIDEKTWNVIVEILSVIDHSRRPNDPNTDAIGNIHILLFGERPLPVCGLVRGAPPCPCTRWVRRAAR